MLDSISSSALVFAGCALVGNIAANYMGMEVLSKMDNTRELNERYDKAPAVFWFGTNLATFALMGCAAAIVLKGKGGLDEVFTPSGGPGSSSFGMFVMAMVLLIPSAVTLRAYQDLSRARKAEVTQTNIVSTMMVIVSVVMLLYSGGFM